MNKVYLGVGSNIDREFHIRAGLAELAELFGELQMSSVYDSEAIGFEGDAFYNLVVGFTTTLPLSEINELITDLEEKYGRQPTIEKFCSRTLDIDVLTYGDFVGVLDGTLLPRPETNQNAYVLKPLAEIAPDEVMPGTEKTYAEWWADFDQESQGLKAVPFDTTVHA